MFAPGRVGDRIMYARSARHKTSVSSHDISENASSFRVRES